jgi:hypothetical protein
MPRCPKVDTCTEPRKKWQFQRFCLGDSSKCMFLDDRELKPSEWEKEGTK